MRHTFSLSIVLASFWWFNSGLGTPLMLSLAAASVAFVIYMAHRMDVLDHEYQPLHFTPKFFIYHLWLTKEIIRANFVVVKHIWLGNHTISPAMVMIQAGQKTDIGKVIYANSITLTPGTVTVDLDGDQILVHGLLQESIEDLEAGEMNRRICLLEN